MKIEFLALYLHERLENSKGTENFWRGNIAGVAIGNGSDTRGGDGVSLSAFMNRMASNLCTAAKAGNDMKEKMMKKKQKQSGTADGGRSGGGWISRCGLRKA